MFTVVVTYEKNTYFVSHLELMNWHKFVEPRRGGVTVCYSRNADTKIPWISCCTYFSMRNSWFLVERSHTSRPKALEYICKSRSASRSLTNCRRGELYPSEIHLRRTIDIIDDMPHGDRGPASGYSLKASKITSEGESKASSETTDGGDTAFYEHLLPSSGCELYE